MKDYNPFLTFLEYAQEKLFSGEKVSKGKFIIDMKNKGYDESLLENLFEKIFDIGSNKSYSENDGFFISNEAYFKLLEYQTLKKVAGFSQNALWYVKSCFVMVIIAFACSIYVSFRQINSPVYLEHSQFNEIKNLKFDPSPIVDKLNKILAQQKVYSTSQTEFQVTQKSDQAKRKRKDKFSDDAELIRELMERLKKQLLELKEGIDNEVSAKKTEILQKARDVLEELEKKN